MTEIQSKNNIDISPRSSLYHRLSKKPLKMSGVFSTIQQTLTDSVRMSILHTTTQRTNTMFDTILYSILISLLTHIAQYSFDFTLPLSKYQDYIRNLFYRKYMLRIEGKTTTATSKYSASSRTTCMYSDKFKAVWAYILNRLTTNRTIYEIREVVNTYRIRIHDEFQDGNGGMFIVCQRERFLLDKELEIYAITTEHTESSEHTVSTQTAYEIVLYSYKSNTNVLKLFVEHIAKRYLAELSDSRTNKRFMYSLTKATPESSQDATFAVWKESEFSSSKTFRNVFFENKQTVIAQIDFFLQNREWYDTYGIPYTLGIGLYGPPGTGKTSFIKALMNHVSDRHLVNLSLSLIRTKTQLYQYYYETRYNENNTANSIGFDKKFIVIEDIDCAGEIVLERSRQTESVDSGDVDLCRTVDSVAREGEEDITLNPRIQCLDAEIQETIKENILSETRKLISKMTPDSDDKITLDDILNLWDGIRETPGRILVITSNHYDKLDAAIRRPGRIDITLGLENASRETIAEMFLHFYGKPIDPDILSKIPSRHYSPAEIVNMYSTYRNDATGFLEKLV